MLCRCCCAGVIGNSTHLGIRKGDASAPCTSQIMSECDIAMPVRTCRWRESVSMSSRRLPHLNSEALLLQQRQRWVKPVLSTDVTSRVSVLDRFSANHVCFPDSPSCTGHSGSFEGPEASRSKSTRRPGSWDLSPFNAWLCLYHVSRTITADCAHATALLTP